MAQEVSLKHWIKSHMLSNTVARKWLLWGISLTLYYMLVMAIIGFFSDPDALIARYAPDSTDYLQLSDWLMGIGDGKMITLRTYFYPLVLALARLPFGNLGVWFVQMLMWLASALILKFNLEVLLPGRRHFHTAVLVLYCACLTPIYLSLMALTETLSMFLFAIATLFILRFWDQDRPLVSVVGLTVTAALLTVTKPNFELVYLGLIVLFVAARLAGRLQLGWSRLGGGILVSFMPILVQFGLHYKATHEFAFSRVGHKALQMSLYPQLLAYQQNRKFAPVLEEVMQASPTLPVMVDALAAAPLTTLFLLNRNLQNNVRLVLHITPHPGFWEHFWRRRVNDFIYWIHLALLLPVAIAFFFSLRLETISDWRFMLLALLFGLGFLPSAISFWAADRWVSPFIVVWPLLYIQAVYRTRQYWPTMARAPQQTHTFG
jgi:hypothetical protein